MKICRFNDQRVGVLVDGEVADVTSVLEELPTMQWPYPRHDVFLERLSDLQPRLQAHVADARRIPLAEVELLSPVGNVGKVIGAPANYVRHVNEARADSAIHHGKEIKTIAELGLFLKATSSLIGPSEPVLVPVTEQRVDHEIELAVVIGRKARNISEDEALSYVAGYTIGLDMTVRGTEDRSSRKSADTFSVLGPWLVTPDEFGDPDQVDFELTVDGETRQRANTRDLIFGVKQLISLASQIFTLEPGDVIMTGTPEGVGPVVPGQKMYCTMDRIGAMSVAVDASTSRWIS